MDTDRIERETLIDASLQRVWDVITSPGVWLGEGDPTGFVLREGETYAFQMGEGKMLQVAQRIEPLRYISYRWAPYPIFKGEAPRDGNTTLVEFILEAQGDQTRLRVVESGFDSLQPEAELRRKGLEDNSKGWDFVLPDLKQRAEAAAA